jgi:hypothetical protein
VQFQFDESDVELWLFILDVACGRCTNMEYVKRVLNNINLIFKFLRGAHKNLEIPLGVSHNGKST